MAGVCQYQAACRLKRAEMGGTGCQLRGRGIAVPTDGHQAASPKPAVPLDPIPAILDAFKTHQIVALGEGAHGNEQGNAFRLALIRDPRFAATVNDIVVELGNARYQDVMDRYVNGGDVSPRDFPIRQGTRCARR
jgi:erythromycin esterase-like protein